MSTLERSTHLTQIVPALAGLAGYLHDVGKLTRHFQAKLGQGRVVRDDISHEWISAWIVQRMLKQGAVDWSSFVGAWHSWETAEEGITDVERNRHQWQPFGAISCCASATCMIVATHHRLFGKAARGERRPVRPVNIEDVAPWQNHVETHSTSFDRLQWVWAGRQTVDDEEKAHWVRVLAAAQVQWELLRALFQDLAGYPTGEQEAFWHKAALLARAAVIQADQQVSARHFADRANYQHCQAFANTLKAGETTKLHQPLTWHLEQVGQLAMAVANHYCAADLPAVTASTRDRLRTPGAETAERFVWQQKAFEFVRDLRQDCGVGSSFLLFNVAGTGSGKTRANVRLLEACRKPEEPLRFTAAFNLKTLTLQTANAYRTELEFAQTECACIIGDPLARAIQQYEQHNDFDAEPTPVYSLIGGNDLTSIEALPAWLQDLCTLGRGEHMARLVATPALVATVDYLVAAGEPNRQAHHAQALLRLAHSDLLIDEADSYDPAGLVAVLRLVRLAAAFGRNVLVASATLSLVVADAIARAWNAGIAMSRACSGAESETHIVLVSNHGETAGQQSLFVQGEAPSFKDWYQSQMAKCYAGKPSTARLAQIAPIRELAHYAATVVKYGLAAHDSHSWQASRGGKPIRISIGLVRMANVDPLMKIAERIAKREWKAGVHIKICPYHARDVAMRRLLKEQALDRLLKRHGNPDLQNDALIQAELADVPEQAQHLLLVVLASPVEEIGRDHDFDWAVTELSSAHALIQLAGRVNRHRLAQVSKPNIYILDRNYKNLSGRAACFMRPGLQQVDRKDQSRAVTHQRPRAVQLLAPMAAPEVDTIDVSTPFALDAGLVFDPARRCRFAEEDDVAITTLLKVARPFLDEVHPQWACDWFYRNFQLRDKQIETTLRFTPTFGGKIQLDKFEPSVWREKWKDCGQLIEQAPPAQGVQWLSNPLDIVEQDMRQLMQQMSSEEDVEVLLDLSRRVSMQKATNGENVRITWKGVGISQ